MGEGEEEEEEKMKKRREREVGNGEVLLTPSDCERVTGSAHILLARAQQCGPDLMTRQLGNVVLSFVQGKKLTHSFSSITLRHCRGAIGGFLGKDHCAHAFPGSWEPPKVPSWQTVFLGNATFRMNSPREPADGYG